MSRPGSRTGRGNRGAGTGKRTVKVSPGHKEGCRWRQERQGFDLIGTVSPLCPATCGVAKFRITGGAGMNILQKVKTEREDKAPVALKLQSIIQLGQIIVMK